MPTITIETLIHAPVERCFDLARDIGFHVETASHTQERAVAGVTTGLIGPGDSVTFEAVHLGVRQRLSSRIAEYERPHRFVDEMTKGAFQSLRHLHEFVPMENGTLMRDTLIWVSPLGPLGMLVDRVILIKHLTDFLKERNRLLKARAESSPV